MNKIQENEGFQIVQECGPFVGLYFDWEKLGAINSHTHHYLVEVVPESESLPKEYLRPNSEGPLHLRLKENIHYDINLFKIPHFAYEVESDLSEAPHIDLISEHEGLHKLVWRNIDWHRIFSEEKSFFLKILVDGEFVSRQHFNALPVIEIPNRPKHIEVRIENSRTLFTVKTNLQDSTPVRATHYFIEQPAPIIHASTITHAATEWRIRSEITEHYQIRKTWVQLFQEKFQIEHPENIVGVLAFQENGEPSEEIRQWGFATKINYDIVKQILVENFKESPENLPRQFRLQLQITTAHRELFKEVLIEKEYFSKKEELTIVNFDESEIEAAEKKLLEIRPHAGWDNAFVELVLSFSFDNHSWQEFQRDNAHSLKWTFLPKIHTQTCQVNWVLFDLENPEKRLTVLESGNVQRDRWPSKVILKPFSAESLLCWWDLDAEITREAIWSKWQIGLSEVGFYLKVHEEYLGNRIHRSDLDQHIINVFSAHQNTYVNVEPSRCFSVEIVARHYDEEIALTPVSPNIVTPRTENEVSLEQSGHRRLDKKWFHTSQREVSHTHGHTTNNRSKVLLHLHMHSPNLYRVEPFRESFIRNVSWPIKTDDGREVHNTPGEWALKNCMDSWLPILRVLKTLAKEGVDFQLSLDISPPVAHMINHPRFKDYMSRYLIRCKEHAKSQIAQMRASLDSPDYIWAAQRYLGDIEAVENFYSNELQKDMIGAFRELELAGFLEISTCTATHGMLSQLETTPDSIATQVGLAQKLHTRIFGDSPKGIWLAENAYFPGAEKFLEERGLNYFFTEAEAILWGSASPKEKEYNPAVVPGSEVVAFGRSQLGRLQVWDASIGYAGHPEFREYHHRHWGLPIKKITSKASEQKNPYNPDVAEQVARELAQDFYQKLVAKGNELADQGEFKSIPLITCSYDAELFGHHWWEGPYFLMELLRAFHQNGDSTGLTTPSHYLASNPVLPSLTPNPSTWGHDSTNIRWTAPKVAWTQRDLERADGLLRQYLAACLRGDFNESQKAMVAQMGAELTRAQSSDLTFVIVAGDFEEDMQREIMKYLDYFYRLRYLVDNEIEDTAFLEFRQYENDMFPEIREFYGI
ncbi:MAG: putative glycosyl hydrolase (DUF1957 family) [bacterium]|jgi:predicted glycosyl hydrolase (DUF1957 family)